MRCGRQEVLRTRTDSRSHLFHPPYGSGTQNRFGQSVRQEFDLVERILSIQRHLDHPDSLLECGLGNPLYVLDRAVSQHGNHGHFCQHLQKVRSVRTNFRHNRPPGSNCPLPS